MIKSGNENLKT